MRSAFLDLTFPVTRSPFPRDKDECCLYPAAGTQASSTSLLTLNNLMVKKHAITLTQMRQGEIILERKNCKTALLFLSLINQADMLAIANILRCFVTVNLSLLSTSRHTHKIWFIQTCMTLCLFQFRHKSGQTSSPAC